MADAAVAGRRVEPLRPDDAFFLHAETPGVQQHVGGLALLDPSSRPGGPIAWEELEKYQGGNHFTIRDADKLLERASSKLLAAWGQAKQALPNA